MKAIEVQKSVIVGYEANDGTRFDNEQECRKYEETARCVINNQYNALCKDRHSFDSFPFTWDDCVRVLKLTSVDELTIANMYAKEVGCGGNVFTADMIGQRIAVNMGYEDHDIVNVYTKQELIKYFDEVINTLFPETSNEKSV